MQKDVDKPADSVIIPLSPRKALSTTKPKNKIMSLIISKNKVSVETLMGVETPAATDSFQPIGHHTLVEFVRKALTNVGLTIVEEEHSLARGGQRYFGGFALTGKGIDGADRQVVLGLRNAHDKSFAAAICIGNRMVVCENLCFSSDVKLARRHTVNILKDIERVIADAVGRVLAHWNDMGERIAAYQNSALTDEQAGNLIVKLVDSKAFPAREIYNAITEFRKPRHVEFEGSTLWSLYNSITENLKGGDLSKLPFRTMTTQSIFDVVAGHRPVIEVQEIITKGCEDNPAPDGSDLREDDDFETVIG
jgi:hypothetical protein